MSASPRFRAAATIVRHELRSTANGLGLYSVLTACFLISFFVAKSYTDSMLTGGIAVSEDPLEYPMYLTTTILALYLALSASMSVPREREQGTLEVLFYGPIDSTAYVVARYIERMLLFIASLASALAYFLAISSLAGLELGLRFWGTALSSGLLASYVIAFGLFISTLSRSVRTSAIAFLLVNAILLAVRVASTVLTGTANTSLSDAMVYVKTGVVLVDNALRWVSPFSYAAWLTDSIELANTPMVVAVATAGVLYALIFIWLSTRTLRARGVRP